MWSPDVSNSTWGAACLFVCSVSQLNSSRVAESFKEYSGFMRFLALTTQGQLRIYSVMRLLALTAQGQLRMCPIVRLLALTTQGQLRIYYVLRLLALTTQG